MAIHYNDNYRAAYQQLQKTLDHLSKVREAVGSEAQEYSADVLEADAQRLFDQVQVDQEGIPRISENSVSSIESVTHAQQSDKNLASAANEAELGNRCRSVWVSVSRDEQWHVKEFLPSNETYRDLAEDSYKDPTVSLERYMEKTVFLLHGEFGSGRCFYDSKGSGLAWAMAEQGYHVFVVDAAGRKFNTGNYQEKSTAQKIKNAISYKSNSVVVREQLPAAIVACGKRAVLNLKERLLESSLVTKPDELDIKEKHKHACMLFDEAVCTQVPRVWVGHGFGAAMLAAAWARMPEEKCLATQMVFFEGHRYWRGGNVLSKCVAGILASSVSRRFAQVLGQFPARLLGLGGTDESAEFFDLYSRWIGQEDWIDPEDGFDYQLALVEKTLPAVLHIMNESEDCVVPGSAVRRFSNELAPGSADLIGIPSSLETIAAENSETELEFGDEGGFDMVIPRFSYSGMLLHPEAKQWLFNPLMRWLDASSNYAGGVEQSLSDQAIAELDTTAVNADDGSVIEQGSQLNLEDFLPSSA